MAACLIGPLDEVKTLGGAFPPIILEGNPALLPHLFSLHMEVEGSDWLSTGLASTMPVPAEAQTVLASLVCFPCLHPLLGQGWGAKYAQPAFPGVPSG